MALTGFWGCRKDTITSTTNESVANANATIPEVFKISVDDVKAWYKGGLPTEAELNGLQTRSERTKTPLGIIPIFPTAFQTIGQYSDSTYRGPIQEVITPIYKDGRIDMNAKQGSFMCFHRDSKGQIQSKLVVFYVDEAAYLDPQKIVTNLTFTGRSVTVDENDNIVSFERLVDGKIVEKGSVSVPFKNTINGFAPGGLSTRDDCPGKQGDCARWGPTWWEKAWGVVKKIVTAVFSGDDDAVGSLGSMSDGVSSLVWQPANNVGGGTVTTDHAANYCQALQSSFSDDQLQAFLDGEVPLSRVGGVVTQRNIDDLKFRNKLRELIADGFECRDNIYPLSKMPQFADCAYNYYKSENKNFATKKYISDATIHVYLNPADKDIVNERGCLYIQKYAPAGFEMNEFVELVKDPVLFGQVDGFLKKNQFRPKDVQIAKAFKELYDSDTEFKEMVTLWPTLPPFIWDIMGDVGAELGEKILKKLVPGAKFSDDAINILRTFRGGSWVDLGKAVGELAWDIGVTLNPELKLFDVGKEVFSIAKKFRPLIEPLTNIYEKVDAATFGKIYSAMSKITNKDVLSKFKFLDESGNKNLLFTGSVKDLFHKIRDESGLTYTSYGAFGTASFGMYFTIGDIYFNFYTESDTRGTPTMSISLRGLPHNRVPGVSISVTFIKFRQP